MLRILTMLILPTISFLYCQLLCTAVPFYFILSVPEIIAVGGASATAANIYSSGLY